MVEVARFWACRASYQPDKDCYMLLGVTGPNEYDNNVNNDFLTNYMAKWCLEYTLDWVEKLSYPLDAAEARKMRQVADKMYLNYDAKTMLFSQQDGFMDKELYPAAEIPEDERPLCKHWSWDRILRSCFIKQADVILAFYYFPADTEDGLHITSMAGSWIALMHGFAGMSYQGGRLSFAPRCPEHWNQVKMRLYDRERLLEVRSRASASLLVMSRSFSQGRSCSPSVPSMPSRPRSPRRPCSTAWM